MKNTETRIQAIRLINKVITLQVNVNNGCRSDKSELSKELPRLQGIKNWAIENNQLPELLYYFGSHNFGQHKQFVANDIRKMFQ